jgi:ribonuclease D
VTDTDADQAVEPEQEPAPPLTPLDMPTDGVPPVVESERALLEAARAIAPGQGTVGHDAPRGPADT